MKMFRSLLLLAFLGLLCGTVLAAPITPNDAGWSLVRRVSQNSGGWHPANDNLLGTATPYGVATSNEIADVTFSVLFEVAVPEWDQVLLMTGDRTKWMVFNKSELLIPRSNQPITVLSSNVSLTPYTVLAFNRTTFPEDPWISSRDHFYLGRDQYSNDEAHSMLYGEAGFTRWSYWRKNHLGANVFVRNSSALTMPIPEPGSLVLLGVALAGLGYVRYGARRHA